MGEVRSCLIVGGADGCSCQTIPGKWTYTSDTTLNLTLTLTLTWRSPFSFLQLPVEIQLQILKLVLEDGFSQRLAPHIHTISYGGDPRPVVRGLALPDQGVLTVSREMRALSFRALYQSPQLPPVYVDRWMQTHRETSITPTVSYTVVNHHCLRRARFWCQVVVPLRTCWMGADGEFLALAWMLSEMRQLQRLTLNIELESPSTMLEQSWCNYQAWQSVLSVLTQLPCLRQVNFTIEAHGRHLAALCSPTPMARKCVRDDEIHDATREWLVDHDQTTFVMTHQGGRNTREDLGALSHALAFVYHVVVTRCCNFYNQGPLPDLTDV